LDAGVSHIVSPISDTTGHPPLHLRPHADLAERVLLPGDPHRALAVAQHTLEGPKIFNHARGLWGYTGVAPDGELLSVQATGMGGPSAAIVIEELIALGARTLIRIGTCGALREGFELGEVVTATSVLAADGASLSLGASADAPAPLDAGLSAALIEHGGGREVTTVSSDLFYDSRPEPLEDWLSKGVDVVEMEAAVLLAIAERRGCRAACLLAVSDLVTTDSRTRLDGDGYTDAGLRLGEVAVNALTAQTPSV
jgi:DeoD family purine-nucleoside phosphorylase